MPKIELGELFLDVCIQNDLMLPGGAMYVPGAAAVVPRMRALIQYAEQNRIPIVSAMETYSYKDPYYERFPIHCVAGTEGWRKVKVTQLDNPYDPHLRGAPLLWRKVFEAHSQVLLQVQRHDPFTNPWLQDILREKSPERVTLFGVPLERGILESARQLHARGIRVRIIENAVRPLLDDVGNRALEELRALEIEFIPAQELIAGITLKRRRRKLTRRARVQPA